MRTIGITFRNALLFAVCVATAGTVVIPSLYMMLVNGNADVVGKPLQLATSHPYVEALATLALFAGGLVVIVVCGLLVRFTSLWTVAAILMAFPALHLLFLNDAGFMPSRFKTAWTMFSFMPFWGWLIAAGVALLLFLVSWPFGLPTAAEEEPVPVPAKKPVAVK